ncbi:unnamed protein product [Ceutorhynchus assimilis]|uniref:Codanin-1 C-terminal domain-containing protein n=1 Tax=Ceutorhynchus assimilis TaxID=467358 RepID=A0A9N9MXN8_9CUCU|nr:unnamed protein product [Ceutorhynchus assimilis]
MADALLNKIINQEIPTKLFIKWLLKAVPENEDDFNDISSFNVGQIDFATYFLNFIHEEVPCKNKLSDTPNKLNTPKHIEKVQNPTPKDAHKIIKVNLFNAQPTDQSPCSDKSLVEQHKTPIKTFYSPGNRNDSSCFSPISPLYQNPKEIKQTRRSVDKYTFSLGDFLTAPRNSSKKKRQSLESIDTKKETSRRINPTNICPKQVNSGFQKTENSFNFQKNTEVSNNVAIEQRNLLLEEKQKILSRRDSIENTSHPLIKIRHNSSTNSDIKPMLSLVTYKNNINNVVDIYKTILDNNLVLNITSEIYFLISLVLSIQLEFENLGVEVLEPKNSLCNSEIFKTAHNVLYFAVKSLETQIRIIQFYDKTTIRLLAENERVREFCPGLSKRLLTYSEKKAESACIELITDSSQSNVCFNIDTDNKENFPDQISFHAFKKQRDLFYEILRVWETHHLEKDWIFSLGLESRIRSLFKFHAGPTNYAHLARLFKNQLLSSCARGPKEKGLSESNLSFLPQLSIDADKLNRLTSRLVTKQVSNGINAPPVFSGYQEFFKEFIVVSGNCFFHKHLCDIFVSDIVELNDTKFSGTELEDESNEVDENTRQLYINCIKDLRILAKFLGFIESLPYQFDNVNLPKNVLQSQVKTRQQTIPALNIKCLLELSIEKHTVVFIIPWLTKYLAMLDYVTLRLPYYTTVNCILFQLYQNYNSKEQSQSNAALVKFCLGWLFELPHFPDIEYYNFCIKNPKIDRHLNGNKKLKSYFLDDKAIANQSVLSLCCPFLGEIKKILLMNGPGSKVAVKYITPVTAVESHTEMGRKKLEQQLEEAFFSGQSTSLRKTIEFVSERIASTAVKYICHDLVPKAKEEANKEFKGTLLKSESDDSINDGEQKKTLLRMQATALAQTHLSRFLENCDEEVQKISRQKIPVCIDSLLPVDALEETKKVCTGITEKMYSERVKQWLNSHVNLNVFTKDFDGEIQRKLTNGRRIEKEKIACVLPAGGRECDHNDETLSGFHSLNNVREACCILIETNSIDKYFVINLLQQTYNSLTQRNDLSDMISVTICVTVFDFCLLIASKVPSILTQELLEYFVNIWALQLTSNSHFKALFCQRNVKLLQDSYKKRDSWDVFARIVSCLFNNNLIDKEELESQCTGFYNRDWDEDTLKNFSYFLKKLVDYSNSTENRFTFLLDFLSNFCVDL